MPTSRLLVFAYKCSKSRGVLQTLPALSRFRSFLPQQQFSHSIPINRWVEDIAGRNQRKFKTKKDVRPKQYTVMDKDVYRGTKHIRDHLNAAYDLQDILSCFTSPTIKQLMDAPLVTRALQKCTKLQYPEGIAQIMEHTKALQITPEFRLFFSCSRTSTTRRKTNL